MMTMKTLSRALPVILALALPSLPALAAGDGAWIAPGISIVEDLTAGLKLLAAAVFVICVVAFGLVTAISGRFDFMRLITIVGGGLLVAGALLLASAVFGGS